MARSRKRRLTAKQRAQIRAKLVRRDARRAAATYRRFGAAMRSSQRRLAERSASVERVYPDAVLRDVSHDGSYDALPHDVPLGVYRSLDDAYEALARTERELERERDRGRDRARDGSSGLGVGLAIGLSVAAVVGVGVVVLYVLFRRDRLEGAPAVPQLMPYPYAVPLLPGATPSPAALEAKQPAETETTASRVADELLAAFRRQRDRS